MNGTKFFLACSGPKLPLKSKNGFRAHIQPTGQAQIGVPGPKNRFFSTFFANTRNGVWTAKNGLKNGFGRFLGHFGPKITKIAYLGHI